MNGAKYIGMDVHTATISAAVRDSSGNLVMEATLETKAKTILEFVHGLRGSLHVSFEEGRCAAWLHDLLKPHVTEVLVCDSRENALLRVGNKNDREDGTQAVRTVVPEQAPSGLSRRNWNPHAEGAST
jgi:transposase